MDRAATSPTGRIVLLLALGTLLPLLACSRPSADRGSSPAAADAGVSARPAVATLPSATNVAPWPPNAPVVTLRDGAVWLDGARVDAAPLADAGHDGERSGRASAPALGAALANLKAAFAGAHRSPPLEVVFALPRETDGDVAVALVLEATSAGFARPALAVRADGGREAVLPLDATSPGPSPAMGDASTGDSLAAHFTYDVSPRPHCTISWLQGSAVMQSVDLACVLAPGSADLRAVPPRVESEWRARGVHRAVGDAERDLLTLHVRGARYASVVALVDAILTPQRALERGTTSAFRVRLDSVVDQASLEDEALSDPAFTVARPGRRGAVSTKVVVDGSLPSAVVRRLTLGHAGQVRHCLARKAGAPATELDVTFTIDATGGVTAVKSEGPPPRTAHACIEGIYRTIAFPEGGAVAKQHWSFEPE